MSEKKIPRPGEKATYLTLLVGREKEQVRVKMKDKGIIIGRNTKRSRVDFDTKPFNGVELGVSREHLLIAPKRDYFYVQDLESVNSTWHNKVRMRPMVAEELYHGDLLHLGEFRVEVFFTYADEVQEDLGDTLQFGDAGGAPATREFINPDEERKAGSTNVFGEDKPWNTKEGKTDVLNDTDHGDSD